MLTTTYPRWSNDTMPPFVHLLARQLIHNQQVMVLAPHCKGAMVREVIDGVRVYRFRYCLARLELLAYGSGALGNIRANRALLLLLPLFLLSQAVHIVYLAWRYKIDIVHAHWIIPQGVIAVVTRVFLPRRTKLLVTAHGADVYALRNSIVSGLRDFVLPRADHVTYVSHAMQTDVDAQSQCGRASSVAPMGVDLQRIFVLPDGEARKVDIVFVGRLVEKKGVDTLIQALALIKPDFSSLRVEILGDGGERTRLEQMAEQLGVSNICRFHGAIANSDIPAWYQSAKVAVVPSVVGADGDQEGLGLVAVEALGCGCALVVSDAPALADVVTDGETGLVFEQRNPQQLAHCLRRLLDDPELRSRLATRGREHVVKHFDWEVVGARYQKIINELVSRENSV